MQIPGIGWRSWVFCLVLASGNGPCWLPLRAVPVQLAQIVRGAGEQPFAFACGVAAPRHHGEILAGL